VTCLADDYQPEDWHKAIRGLENEPEKGARCISCFEYRLKRTFEFAKQNNIGYVTTVLTVAPYKDSKTVFDIAGRLSKEYGVKFLELDFKKNNGYARTKKLAAENGLYVQNYCGCEFSLLDRKQRICGEL
jgi:predicted adenine nucleotide alpha hydrolase (AANH) superfamily ATPase